MPDVPRAAPSGPAARFAFTGPQLAASVVGVFLAGALAGAGGLLAWLSRDGAHETPIVRTDERPPPVPVSLAERAPESPLSVPSSARGVVSAPGQVSSDAGAAGESATLLQRAREALARSPARALALADEHGRQFPRRNAADREEIAVRALVQLGQRAEASARAARLVKLAPSFRAEMAAMFGDSSGARPGF